MTSQPVRVATSSSKRCSAVAALTMLNCFCRRALLAHARDQIPIVGTSAILRREPESHQQPCAAPFATPREFHFAADLLGE